MSRPLRSTPTPASRSFTATTGRSAGERRNRYSVPSVSASARSLSRPTGHAARGGLFRRSPSHVPCKSRRPGSRRLYAERRLASTRTAAKLITRAKLTPAFDAISRFTTPQQRTPHRDDPGRALLERLPGPHLTRSCRAVSLSLPGSRRESHPPAPTDPHVSLSTHTARAVRLSGQSAAVPPVHEQLGVPCSDAP
jgi:hypothetical protein